MQDQKPPYFNGICKILAILQIKMFELTLQLTYLRVREGDQIVSKRRLHHGIPILLEEDHRRLHVHVDDLQVIFCW